MKTLAISVKERLNVGKTNTRALRNQGNVPCVLYGGEKQVTFYAHENDFRKLVYTPETFVVNLDVDGKKTKAIMQDIQFHPVTEKILHIDFLEVLMISLLQFHFQLFLVELQLVLKMVVT